MDSAISEMNAASVQGTSKNLGSERVLELRTRSINIDLDGYSIYVVMCFVSLLNDLFAVHKRENSTPKPGTSLIMNCHPLPIGTAQNHLLAVYSTVVL